MIATLADVLFRAGGGQGFDGGGGGGTGGGGLGGGGFLFFGGGGGGAATGTVVVVGIILLVVVMRLTWPRWRGGGRTGGVAGAPPSPSADQWRHDDQPAINTVQGDLFPGTAPSVARSESAADGLAAISAHDPAFSKEVFLEQAQRTFFIVQEAWTQRQPGMSRQVMADGLWQQHRTQIQGYLDAHKRNVLEDLAVADLTIIGAHHDQSYDTITVRVVAACADYDVDDGHGRVVRGSKEVHQWAEDWTFQRAASATTPSVVAP